LILLADIGNSRTKYLLKNVLASEGSASVVNNRDISIEWLAKNWSKATKLILACVADKSLIALIECWAKDNGICISIIKSERQSFGVTSFYQNPTQLGVDRWLAMLGANILFPKENLLVVDAGTATTIDCLTADGQHRGGWILPGIDIMFSSLLANTANIDATLNRQESLSFGESTTSNVNSACWAATVGAIELAIRQSTQHFSLLDRVVLTGGNAEQVQVLIAQPTTLVKNLVFHGLGRF
jgi:type III pantothenate kinase